MKFDALLFDLDGTLIDFDFREFIKVYLGAASQFFLDLIPNPEKFYQEIMKSTDVMETADNDDTTSLDDFLIDFCPKFEADCDKIKDRFLLFYQTEYEVVKPIITQMEGAPNLLMNIRKSFPETIMVLATNPVFPFVAVKRRMEWGGIPEDVFDLITHAENSRYCKGNKKYWTEIVEKIGVKPQKSLMIGNDGFRDMVAKKYGFNTFLIETSMENKDLITEETYPDYNGSLEDLQRLLFS
ncbi:MAG: HAD family hydrolase [Candidatus Heimdallarchaeaceae archaeon]